MGELRKLEIIERWTNTFTGFRISFYFHDETATTFHVSTSV